MFMSNTLSAQCPATPLTGCGTGTFTEFSILSGNSGMGTETSPLIGDVEARICFDLETFNEELENWVHGVFLRNVPGKTYSNTGSTGTPSGMQDVTTPSTLEPDAYWNWLGFDDGLATTDYPTTVTGTGFVPYPGFYVTEGSTDMNPRDNFGDPGENFIPENYELEPFCFYVTLSPPNDGLVKTWSPVLGVSGDGSTGSHAFISLTCVIADFAPSCGGSDGNGNVFYQSDEPCVAQTNPTGAPACTTPPITSCPSGSDSNPSDCGVGSFTDFSVISTHTETGADVNNPLIANSVEVRVCYDVETFNEVGLGFLHGVFIRDVPAGSLISNQGSCGDGSGVQPVANPGTNPGDAAANWIWAGYDDGISEIDYPNEITGFPPAFGDGDGLIPYPGFYAVDSDTDCNPRDNFGDQGLNTNNPVLLENFDTYDLEPFCFYITLFPPNDGLVYTYTPNIGVSSDGSTGGFALASAPCFTVDNTPSCGGSDTNGNVFYQHPGTILATELSTFTGKNEGDINVIEFTTATESDMAQHIVERSIDGQKFAEMNSVAAMNRSVATSYQVEDNNPAALTYYRLRSISNDGAETLSAVITIRAKTNEVLNVHPVPTTNTVHVDYVSKVEASKVTVLVTDFVGRTVQTQQMNFDAGLNNFQVDLTKQAAGVYFLSIQDGDQVITQRLIKE